MSGVLDTFRSRVPALADQVGEQLAVRNGLRESIDAAYEASLADFDEASKDGSLLRGEVLARWQDFARHRGPAADAAGPARPRWRQAKEAAHAGQGARAEGGAGDEPGVADRRDR